MPVPTTIADLTTNEATNYPADSDSVTPTTRPSDYIRAHAAIIKTLESTVATNLTNGLATKQGVRLWVRSSALLVNGCWVTLTRTLERLGA